MDINNATTYNGQQMSTVGQPSLLLGSSSNWATAHTWSLGSSNTKKAMRVYVDQQLSGVTMSPPSRPRRVGSTINDVLSRRIFYNGYLLGTR